MLHGASSLRVTATSMILLPHISCIEAALFSTRWPDLETIFNMQTSALKKYFWEVVEEFSEQRGALLETFLSDLIKERAHMNANLLKEKGHPWKTVWGS